MSRRKGLSGPSENTGKSPVPSPRHKGLLFWISFLVVAGLLAYVVVISVFPYLVWSRLRHISNSLALQSGLSPNLMLGLMVLATIPFFWAVWKYAGGIFRLWIEGPSLRLYSNRYGIIIVCYVAAFFFAHYFASRHAYFSKWCADTPEGIKVFDTRGTGRDPTYGIKLHPCTFAEIVALRRTEVSVASPNRIHVSDPEHFAFFDPVTGAPRVWYFRSSTGTYRLYNGPGRDSDTGVTLHPIDGPTRHALIKLENQGEQRAAQAAAAESEARHSALVARYLNTGIAAPSGAKGTAVLILENNGQELSGADEYLLDHVSQYGATPVRSLFKSAFISEGHATALFNGDWNQARQLALASHIAYLFLGTAHVSYSKNGALEGVRTAKLDLRVKALNVASQSVVDGATIDVAGAGFNESAALDNAIVHAEPQLASFARTTLRGN